MSKSLRKIFILLTGLIVFFSTSKAEKTPPKNNFLLQVQCNIPDSGHLSLVCYTDFSDIKIQRDSISTQDSIIIFKGSIDYPHLIRIVFWNKFTNKISDPFFISPGKQKLLINLDYFLNFEINLIGNKTQDEYENEFAKCMQQVNRRSEKWYSDVEQLNNNAQTSDKERDTMLVLLGKINFSQDSLIVDYIRKNPDSYVGFWMLVKSFYNRSYKSIYEAGYNEFGKKIKKTASAKKFYRALLTSSLLAIGTDFPEFNFKDTSGKRARLIFKGHNFTIIDFWFSYCNPCIQDFNEIRDFYDLLMEKNIQFVAVSTDKTKDLKNWHRVITSKKYLWPQFLDENGIWVAKYNINTYPYNIVVDSKGKIILRNISPESLRNRISLMK